MNFLTSSIRTKDLFGHSIALNFNRRGSSHKTFIGGSFSILIYAFMIFLFWINIEKLVFSLDDKNTTYNGLIDSNDTTTVNFNQTNLFNFYVIRKQIGDKPIYVGKEIEKYI